uniref:Transmembrane protein n=1 Tax=Chromera velia CCMP2878 TaxID=1169474 RepID=A0A0G4HRF9_9ALVE|eukprot:Cvel_8116.t1-p1 / transcript=Cvel_8116.t1 / gene=Cvel_8116 / organism=Chromera_velia_CCMP2878 / gene_product=hypothetical protein / transcript_product=hypothetical protein / location=Cvel_scaffold441:73025-74579(+) / protein_length=368 / sequence_SO=supercontig / SO=protein_coding / is_pseudo=false
MIPSKAFWKKRVAEGSLGDLEEGRDAGQLGTDQRPFSCRRDGQSSVPTVEKPSTSAKERDFRCPAENETKPGVPVQRVKEAAREKRGRMRETGSFQRTSFVFAMCLCALLFLIVSILILLVAFLEFFPIQRIPVASGFSESNVLMTTDASRRRQERQLKDISSNAPPTSSNWISPFSLPEMDLDLLSSLALSTFQFPDLQGPNGTFFESVYRVESITRNRERGTARVRLMGGPFLEVGRGDNGQKWAVLCEEVGDFNGETPVAELEDGEEQDATSPFVMCTSFAQPDSERRNGTREGSEGEGSVRLLPARWGINVRQYGQRRTGSGSFNMTSGNVGSFGGLLSTVRNRFYTRGGRGSFRGVQGLGGNL